MKSSDAAAAAAAARARAEAARRAEEARKRAAEAAARKAAEAARQQAAAKQKPKPTQAEVKKAHADLSKKVGDKATASAVRQAFGKDEVSKGLGLALRQRAASQLGGPAFSFPQVELPPRPSAPGVKSDLLQRGPATGVRSDLLQRGPASPTLSPLRADAAERAARTGSPALTPLTARGAQGPTSANAAEHASTVTNPQEAQAKADAAKVEAAWEAELSRTNGNEAMASRAAAEKMNELVEAHPNDVAYANALVRNSSETIEKIATTAGKNAAGKAYYKDGDDDEAIKDTMVLLSDVAESSGALGTYQLAEALAQELPDRDELEAVDDGFYRAIEDGHSDALFGAVYQRMKAAGKDEGAKELIEKGGGFDPLGALGDLVGTVRDVAGDAIGVVGDAGSAVVGAVQDGLHVVTEVGEFVVDTAKGTVNLAKDLAEASFDEVKGAVQYAVEMGLELAGDVRDFLRDKAMGVAGQAVGRIDDLAAGESVDLSVDLDVSLGVSVGVNGSVSVTRTDEGYVVAGQVGADFGLAGGAEGEVGLSGRMEMTFATAEEAKAAAQNLLLMGSSGVSPVLMPVLAPSPDTLATMKEHLTAVELSGSAAAEIDGLPGDGLEGQAGVSTSYRMEFEDGKPVALVRTTSLDGSLSAGLPKELTDSFKAAGLNLDVGAQFEGSVELETRIPISGDLGGQDILAFIASPASATVAGEAESSLTLTGSVDGSSTGGVSAGVVDVGTTTTTGTEVSLTIGDIDADEIGDVFGRVIRGDLGNAFKGVEVTVSGGFEQYQEVRTGIDADFTIAGQGVEASAGRTRRDVLNEKEFEVALG